jgi:hypothetical protein
VLELGAPMQRLGLIVGKPESHRHASMVSRLIPWVRLEGCRRGMRIVPERDKLG